MAEQDLQFARLLWEQEKRLQQLDECGQLGTVIDQLKQLILSQEDVSIKRISKAASKAVAAQAHEPAAKYDESAAVAAATAAVAPQLRAAEAAALPGALHIVRDAAAEVAVTGPPRYPPAPPRTPPRVSVADIAQAAAKKPPTPTIELDLSDDD